MAVKIAVIGAVCSPIADDRLLRQKRGVGLQVVELGDKCTRANVGFRLDSLSLPLVLLYLCISNPFFCQQSDLPDIARACIHWPDMLVGCRSCGVGHGGGIERSCATR